MTKDDRTPNGPFGDLFELLRTLEKSSSIQTEFSSEIRGGPEGEERDVAIETRREDGDWVAVLDVPGFTESDIEVKVANGSSIEVVGRGGEGAGPSKINEVIDAPPSANFEEASATINNGILSIRIPVEGNDEEGGRITVEG